MKLATITRIDKGQRQMPSNNGFINLWRDIEQQPWSNDAVAFGVFTKLMLRVQHKAYVTEYKGLKVALQPGERVLSYPDIVDMFKQVTDKDHAIRLIKKFKSLSQVYTRELKEKNVHLGFVLGFFGWEKWQNCTTPLTTPTTTPKATNLKALQVGKTTPQTTPPTTHINNNVLNKLKESDRQANLSHLKSAFEHIWKKWKSCKSNIGKTDTSPKTKTFDKNFKSIFNTAYFNKNSQAVFKAEINQLSKFIEKAHEIQGFNRFENMQLPKFLNEKQWRD